MIGFNVTLLMRILLNYRLPWSIPEIMRSAQLISSRDFTSKVHARGGGEIDQLSTVFNIVALRLQRVERLMQDIIVAVAHQL